ncbi:MAG: MFS transporter [Nitrososphaerales archaeon]
MALLHSRFLSGIPKRVKSLILVLSLNTLGIGYFVIVLTAYLPELGVGSRTVGTIVGAEGITLVLTGVPLGLLSDRRGRKWILTLGAAGLSPVLFILALTTNSSYLILAGTIAGIAEGGFLSTVNAIIADQTPEEARVSAFSFSFILSTISFGIGSALPFAFPYFESLLGVSSVGIHRDLLLVFGVLAIATPFGIFSILRNYREKPSSGTNFSSAKNLKNLAKFSGANSLIGLGAGFIIPLIATWFFLKFSIADNYSGPLLAVSNITIGLSATLSPKMARRFGLVKAIVINQGFSTVFMLSLAFVGDPASAAGLYIVRAALMNMSSPLADSFLMGIVPQEQRGLASAINSVVWRLPNSVTTIIGGIILASGDYSLPFELAALFYICAICLFYAFFKDVKLQASAKP